VELLHHPIAGIVSEFSGGFEAAFGQPLQGIALENLQARARGTILMEYSNSFGHLLLTTGNKSEISVGYCTLYGDTNGGLGLIGDLYKTEVFALSTLPQRSGRARKSFRRPSSTKRRRRNWRPTRRTWTACRLTRCSTKCSSS
jgi:NAD+ synthetase